jgi:HAD superfamily hydrolase (TIGR01450 family)
LTWALDLDGVVWLAGRAIAGSAEAVTALRDAGQRVVFLTNNSGPLVRSHLEALARIGIDVEGADLVTSAQAAASMLPTGSRVMVIGDAGVNEALGQRGIEVVPLDLGAGGSLGPRQGDVPDAVVVGRTVSLDYRALGAAATAIRAGARFIATNTDTTFPTGEGLLPGAGALVAFVAAAAGREPEVAGKPGKPMAELVRARYGRLDVVAGDRPSTDGLFAKEVGARFGLVLSGVTGADDLPVEPVPDLVGPDLARLVSDYLRQG